MRFWARMVGLQGEACRQGKARRPSCLLVALPKLVRAACFPKMIRSEDGGHEKNRHERSSNQEILHRAISRTAVLKRCQRTCRQRLNPMPRVRYEESHGCRRRAEVEALLASQPQGMQRQRNHHCHLSAKSHAFQGKKSGKARIKNNSGTTESRTPPAKPMKRNRVQGPPKRLLFNFEPL